MIHRLLIRIFISVLLLAPWGANAAAPAPVAKTGQTTSYAAGDDGALQPGVASPTPRFSNNGDQTVTDNLTGLIWTQNANLPAATKTWQQALDYVAAMNSANSGAGTLGHNDWRLPNRKELWSLGNFGQAALADWLYSQGFTNVQANYYWSSSSIANYTDFAWGVNMDGGDVDYDYKANYHFYVWPVRSGQSGSFGSLALSPISKDFGNVNSGETSSVQTFTLSNSGNASLAVSSITVTGGDSSQFNLALGTCGAAPTIAASGSCTISTSFAPTSLGAKATTLRIASNDQSNPTTDAALTGTGVVPTYTIGTTVNGGNGSISCDTPVTKGGSSVCAITPATGFHLATFTDNAVNKLSAITNNSYTLSNVQADHAIVGSFSVDLLSVTTTINGGNGSISCDTPVTKGGSSVCAITPANGFHLATFTDNAVNKLSAITNNSYTLSNVQADHAIVGSFSDALPSVTITSKPLAKPVAFKGGKGTVTFTAPANTTLEALKAAITVSPSWIIFDPASVKFAKGKGSLAFTYGENSDPAERSGQITIATASYSITQAAHPCTITGVAVTPVTPLLAAGGEQSLTVNVEPATCQWKIVSYKMPRDSWFSAPGSFPPALESLPGNTTVTGTVGQNTTGKARTNAIAIATVDGKSRKRVTLKQNK